jgi:hypothetical protein
LSVTLALLHAVFSYAVSTFSLYHPHNMLILLHSLSKYYPSYHVPKPAEFWCKVCSHFILIFCHPSQHTIQIMYNSQFQIHWSLLISTLKTWKFSPYTLLGLKALRSKCEVGLCSGDVRNDYELLLQCTVYPHKPCRLRGSLECKTWTSFLTQRWSFRFLLMQMSPLWQQPQLLRGTLVKEKWWQWWRGIWTCQITTFGEAVTSFEVVRRYLGFSNSASFNTWNVWRESVLH